MTSIELKTLPLGTSLYSDARLLCSLGLGEDGLWIAPSADIEIFLQRASDSKVISVSKKQRLNSEIRSDTSFWLHLGTIEEEHVVWRFKW